jgi:hypothetical protein
MYLFIYLFIYLSIYLFIYIFIYIFIYLFIYLHIYFYLCIYLLIYLFTYLFMYLFIYLFTYLFIYLCIHLLIYLFIYLLIYIFIYLSIYLAGYIFIDTSKVLTLTLINLKSCRMWHRVDWYTDYGSKLSRDVGNCKWLHDVISQNTLIRVMFAARARFKLQGVAITRNTCINSECNYFCVLRRRK